MPVADSHSLGSALAGSFEKAFRRGGLVKEYFDAMTFVQWNHPELVTQQVIDLCARLFGEVMGRELLRECVAAHRDVSEMECIGAGIAFHEHAKRFLKALEIFKGASE